MSKKYEEIADRISNWILESAYGPGDRLPSIRNLSDTLLVSITTVTAALRVLESRGIVQVKDRAGCFVSPWLEQQKRTSMPSGKHASAPRDEEPVRDHLRLNKMNAIQLGSATPSDLFLPTRQIQRSLLRASRRTSESLGYSYPGSPDYLNAIARRMTSIGVISKASDIISMGGAQEALALAVRTVTREGDQVAIGVPASPGALQALRALGRTIIEIPCEEDGRLSLNTLEMVISNSEIRAICVSVNVSNPTGYCMSQSDKVRLLEIASRKDIPLIEDDVFGDLQFEPHRPEPLKAYDTKGSVIYCGSFSKTVSPGLRCGWIMPGKYYAEISDQKYFMNLSSPAVTQAAISDYLDSGSHDRYLRKIRKIYLENVRGLRSLVLDEFPKGTTATAPSGGFLFWVSLPEEINTTEVYRSAISAQVCYAPGQIFSSTGKFANCLRMSGARPFDVDTKRALSHLAKAFHRLKAGIDSKR